LVRRKKAKIMRIQNNDWIQAKEKYHLTDDHVRMAKELGMNPRKFGSLANHKQEKWKAPLSEFIKDLYFRRFGREKPENTQ